MAVSITACTPTQRPVDTKAAAEQQDHTHPEPPAGAVMESTVDGALEKENMVVEDADPTVMVCIYSVNKEKNGLKQNMDGIDGETLDAQLLMDKMAELGVVEEGIEVTKFENDDGSLTMDLSELKDADDELTVTAIANTFVQNYEAKELNLSVAGEKVGDGPMSFLKEYKKIK